MSKEIIINAEREQTRIAIVNNGDLTELYIETPENTRTIGNIHLGRIRRVMPQIQAAFVDIGQKQDAFLHFSDLSDQTLDWLEFVKHVGAEVSTFKAKYGKAKDQGAPPTDSKNSSKEAEKQETEKSQGGGREAKRKQRRSAQRRGLRKPKNQSQSTEQTDASAQAKPEEFLRRDAPILVKIVKEPISAKGSRVSTDISLAGRFLVLVPLGDYVAVSKKIQSYKERRRLRALAKSLLPDGFGLIVRTVARGKNAKALDTDLRLLLDRWNSIEKKLAKTSEPPAALHEDVSLASSVIRDLFSDDYDRILLDDQRQYKNIKGYIQAVAPHMADAVQLHKGNQPIFQFARIERSVNEAFSSRVELPSGGYLFIEHTEAMHVVDVNSGRSVRGLSQEENSLRVNLEAARAIAKQIRLRDLGGIIVVDFIDLREDKNSKKVYDELRRAFRTDRAVSKILPMSDFGLMQITRQRIRPSITTTMTLDTDMQKAPSEPNTSSKDNRRQRSRSSKSPEQVVKEIDKWVADYKARGYKKPITLKIHPFTAAYLNRSLPNRTTRWFMKYFLRVKVQVAPNMDPLNYRFLDTETGKDITRSLRNGRAKALHPLQDTSQPKNEEKTTNAPRKSKSSNTRRKPSGTSSNKSSGTSNKSSGTGNKSSGANTDRTSEANTTKTSGTSNKTSNTRRNNRSRHRPKRRRPNKPKSEE